LRRIHPARRAGLFYAKKEATMPLHLIDQDKANHEIYGARIACVCGTLATAAAAVAFGNRAAAQLIGALVAQGSALAAGWGKEQLDKRANAKWLADPANAEAIAAGARPPHSVERGDIVHTAYGGTWVAVPLAVAGLFALGV
jgi:hypothetical protein